MKNKKLKVVYGDVVGEGEIAVENTILFKICEIILGIILHAIPIYLLIWAAAHWGEEGLKLSDLFKF